VGKFKVLTTGFFKKIIPKFRHETLKIPENILITMINT